MNEKEFREALDTIVKKSGNALESYLSQFDDPVVIGLLGGSEFDDIGIGRTTARKAAETAFSNFEDDGATLTESLEKYDGGEDGYDIDQLYLDLEMLNSKSGNDQQGFLAEMFEDYAFPSVVSFAVLNDLGTGIGESTLASAFNVEDSLPFYESVADIVRDDDPMTEPVPGSAFRPQLAKSESSLPDDKSDLVAQVKLDGYRILIHIFEESGEQRVKAFTRNMKDVTASLPELQAVDWPGGEYIVDGEVIASDGTYKSTSERVGKKAENVDRDNEMRFALFDIIYYGGTEYDTYIYKKPYRERYSALASFTISIPRPGNEPTVYSLMRYDNEETAVQVSRDYEGLIWKDREATYEFDKRSSAWIKEKNTAEAVDVVAVDFVEGEGRLDGTLGKIMLESADGVPVGATGSGFSDEERDEIWQNRSDYLNETLEVEAEAFDEGLRFPIFQRWRVDDGEPDDLDRIQSLLPSA